MVLTLKLRKATLQAWRLKTWKELRILAKEFPLKLQFDEIVGSENNILFKNNTAESSFQLVLGYVPGES